MLKSVVVVVVVVFVVVVVITQIKIVSAALYWKLKLELLHHLTGILNSLLSILYV